mmetsp:Transcript_16181/g.35893  ORF Transcript_16181/g.35893 Transcript_16181/m.35893 type:complete len:96 (+) Transcript_16181:2069-2356(+)
MASAPLEWTAKWMLETHARRRLLTAPATRSCVGCQVSHPSEKMLSRGSSNQSVPSPWPGGNALQEPDSQCPRKAAATPGQYLQDLLWQRLVALGS